MTIDVPGDGPSRATLAYAWALHPEIDTWGNWLPGFSYMAGLLLMVIPDPLLVPRVFNVALDAMAIAAFYALMRRLYGSQAALLSGIALVALPLRIGLTASSLTEPCFLSLMILGLLCLAVALDTPTKAGATFNLALFLSVVFFDLAEITRYEIWPFVPVIIGYIYARCRRISVTALAAAGLLAVPIAWSIGNYFHYGNFLYPFFKVSHPIEGGRPVGLEAAILQLWDSAGNQIGWLLSIGIIAGMAGELYRMIGGRLDANRAAYMILVGSVGVMIFQGTLKRGPAMYDRFLLLGFALAIPLAIVAYLEVAGRYRYRIAIGIVAIAASLAMPYYIAYPLTHRYTPIFVTRRMPTDIIALARWLPTSPYRNDAILLTKMDWDSTYLPLYAPELIERSYIVSVWSGDDAGRAFIAEKRPTLLVTRRGDGDDRARIIRLMRRPLHPATRSPVFTSGVVEVYDISGVIPEHH